MPTQQEEINAWNATTKSVHARRRIGEKREKELLYICSYQIECISDTGRNEKALERVVQKCQSDADVVHKKATRRRGHRIVACLCYTRSSLPLVARLMRRGGPCWWGSPLLFSAPALSQATVAFRGHCFLTIKSQTTRMLPRMSLQ